MLRRNPLVTPEQCNWRYLKGENLKHQMFNIQAHSTVPIEPKLDD